MSERTIPNSLQEKFIQERADLYALLWKLEDGIASLASGSVSSYSLGNRSVSYQNLDQLKALRDETENRIDEIEAKLSHRSPRCVTQNTILSPSYSIPRRVR